jgi:hypothetical protein
MSSQQIGAHDGDDTSTAEVSTHAFTLRSRARPTIDLVRKLARIADLLLVAFLVSLALATAAQVHHNQAAGPHGHAPHDPPVAAGRPGQL